ncbi:MAG: hypothetical protein ACOH1K_04275, partial [Rhodoglobus sp.]
IVSPDAASASIGAVPPEVTAYAQATDGLAAELDDYFGTDENGNGLDFSHGIQLGAIDRIFVWSAAYREGTPTDEPIQSVNSWKVTVLIGNDSVGTATIATEQSSMAPEMTDFVRSASTTAALAVIDSTATLVYEPETAAWFSLTGEQIIPLVAGDSGVSAPTTLALYQPLLSGRAIVIIDRSEQPDQGSMQSVMVIASALLLLLIILLVPTLLGRRHTRNAIRENDADPELATRDDQQ